MAMIKLLEYTFDNTVDANCLPAFIGVGTTEVIDEVSDNVTKRIINVEKTGLPTKIGFGGKKALLTLEYVNTSNVTNMNSMFNECSNLTSLDLSSSDTSRVVDMFCMLGGCSKLVDLNVSNIDTSKVTNMQSMLLNCSSLVTLDLSSLNISKVQGMNFMLQGCTNLTTLDISNLSIPTGLNISTMFTLCNKLQNIGLLYSPTSTINTIASLLPTTIAKKIYYQDAISSDLTPINNIEFVEYQANTISTNEIVLRSLPNGVCDTLDLETGEYVQRVGEVVLDGSEDENWVKNTESSSAIDFYLRIEEKAGHSYQSLLPIIKFHKETEEKISTVIDTYHEKNLALRVSKDTLEGTGVENFKDLLSKNPITVQYELETPITTTIDLNNNQLYSYKDTTYLICSGEELAPILSVDVPTSLSALIARNNSKIQEQNYRISELKSKVSSQTELLSLSKEVNTEMLNTLLLLSAQTLDEKKEVK